MNENHIHDLAVAYAQAKLMSHYEKLKNQPDFEPFSCDSDEMKSFAKAYRFALDNFENEFDEIG